MKGDHHPHHHHRHHHLHLPQLGSHTKLWCMAGSECSRQPDGIHRCRSLDDGDYDDDDDHDDNDDGDDDDYDENYDDGDGDDV